MPRPFERQPFTALKETPRRAHRYFEAEKVGLPMVGTPFGDLKVRFRRMGKGPPLLLVHGLMTSSYSWRYVIGPLAERFTVIAPDLPGAGESDKPGARYSAENLARWLGQFIDAMGLRGVTTIGNSLGGYLCLQLALQDPAAMGRLVNIHSPGLPEPRLWALKAAMTIPGVRRGLAWVVRRSPERWAHGNVHYFDETLKSREEARIYGKAIATSAGAAAFVSHLADSIDATELARFRGLLRARREAGQPFPIPLLMVYARQDPMVPPRIGERLAALIPDARLVWLEESSHFAQVDSPEALLAVIDGFISPSGGGAG